MYKININNYINFKERNNFFFSNYLKKFLIKRHNDLELKNFILKSYSKLYNSINKACISCNVKNLIIIRLLTFLNILFYLSNALKKSFKNNININVKKYTNKKVFVCFEFPIYAFNKSKNNNSSFYNSISSKYSNFKILSLDGYIKKKIDNEIQNENVDFKNSLINLKYFFLIIYSSIKKMSKVFFLGNLPLEIKLIIFANLIKIERIKIICEKLKKKELRIDSIFFLAQNNPFHRNDKLNEILIGEFFYSDNVFSPTINKIDRSFNLKKTITPAIWSLTNHQCGLVDNLNIVEKYKSNFLKIEKNINLKKIYIQKTMMGFKKQNNNIIKGEYSILFDNPGESSNYFKKLGTIEFGFDSAPDFCSNFLNDFLNLIKKYNYKILLKPKYSKVNYAKIYEEKIEEFRKLNLLIDPYQDMADLINGTSNIFCCPYSSASRIYDSEKSFFYIPESFRPAFYNDKKLIIGKKDLENFLISK